MSETNKSEVARAMERIDLEMEAISHLKHGYTMTSRHDFINARAQRGAERILGLIDRGKHEEAQILMNTENWGSRMGNMMRKHHLRRERKDKQGKIPGAKRGKQKRTPGYPKITIGEQKMKLAGEPEFPLLPISFNDLTALRSILSGYLAALRRTPGTQQRQKLIQVLESLPAEMEQKLFQFVRLFGLQYSSMDMILSQEGEYVWVEANPSGQFLWLAPPTGLPMAEAMANLLYNPEEYGLW